MRVRSRLKVIAVVVVGIAGLAVMVGNAGASTYAEQQGHHGANTFLSYHNASGVGPRVDPAAWVNVSRKVYDTYIQSVNPDGYWYRLADSPWNDEYYAAANTFMNGDPWNGPYTHNTDFNVPDCGASPPPTTTPPPRAPVVSLAQGPEAPLGYRYAVTLDHFSPGSAVSVSCRDNRDPNGFWTLTLTTDGAGHAFTQSECYSNDGPDHWVVANRASPNHAGAHFLRASGYLTYGKTSPSARTAAAKSPRKLALRDEAWLTASQSCGWDSVPVDAAVQQES